MHKIAIFSSGTGTNAEQIIKHFNHNLSAKVACILTNKIDAGIHEVAERNQIAIHVIRKDDLENGITQRILSENNIYLIALAGFLLKIPAQLIQSFGKPIVNIHPSLLPKYGGKGMYGSNVHQAVLENNETQTGITIHLVNEEYDRGAILFQTHVEISDCESVEDIASAVQVLEHEHYPIVIEQLLTNDEQYPQLAQV